MRLIRTKTNYLSPKQRILKITEAKQRHLKQDFLKKKSKEELRCHFLIYKLTNFVKKSYFLS